MVEFLFVWNVALTAACAWLYYENAGIKSLKRSIVNLQSAVYALTTPTPPVETESTAPTYD